MTLRRVQVTDFRCLQSAMLDLDPRFTLIYGANGSGKTSLLEAIYLLGRGRSFRTRRLEYLIGHGKQAFVVFGEVEAFERRVNLGVEGRAGGVRARVAGKSVASLAELAALLPVQILDPEIHRLIEEGPSRRRRFVDWGVFHVEPQFVGDWQRFQQAHKQRNAALKSRQPKSVTTAWDADFIRYGELLGAARARYVVALGARAAGLVGTLLNMQLRLSYRSGWARGSSLAESLETSWSHDLEFGASQVGPHRAEVSIFLNERAVKDRISRGQQKLLAAALLLAQIELFPVEAPVRPTLLLDDPAAELDSERLRMLIQEVSGQSIQLVVTTLQSDFSDFGTPGTRYELLEGAVRQA